MEFVDTIPMSSDGSSIPDLPRTSVFGLYAQRLRDDVFHFLVVSLPQILQIEAQGDPAQTQPHEPNGRDVLLQIFSRVPFEMFKAAVESPTFPIGM